MKKSYRIVTKNVLYLCTTMLLLFFCVSCSDDNDLPVEIDETDIRLTDISGSVLEYTKDLEIGNNENDIVFAKNSEIVLAGVGLTMRKTLDCYGLGATAYDGMEMDTTKIIENVTLINRGTITVHTKDLVERYKDLIATPENPDRPYFYLRVLVMYAGNNCTVINKGKINVYFDHDRSNTSTIYTIALTGGDGSTIINEGEIHFYGTGSLNTRFRGIATTGDYVTANNKGIITSEVEMVDDQRGITTGGEYNNITNDGSIIFHGPGEIVGLSSPGNNVVNNNLIDITHVDTPDTYFPVVQETGIVGGIYCSEALYDVPPVVNRGTIKMKAITTSVTPQEANVAGFYLKNDLGGIVNMINEGTITVTQEGSTKINTAEAFFRSGNKPFKVNMKCWVTTLRDFTKEPLFFGSNADLNFSDGKLALEKGEGYVEGTQYSVSPESLFRQTNKSVYSNYEDMTITSNDENVSLTWNKKDQKASLSSKE